MFRVLLPIDADENRGMAAAEIVASLPGSADELSVVILNVEEEVDITGDDHITSTDWYDKNSYPSIVKEIETYFEERGIEVDSRRMHADPAEAIIEVASGIDADRIVMAGRKKTPVGKVLFGSVTQSVLLNSDIPVTVSTGV